MSIINNLKTKFNEMFPNENEPEADKSIKPVRVLMLDGTTEEYDGMFHITDGINCMVCDGSPFYHTHMDCETIQDAVRHGFRIRAMEIYEANHKGIDKCYQCQKKDDIDAEWERMNS